mmetsp:Transcript_4134/g.10087  ORF Transcript_4134/g.10087 Transcript_4134/m.10087 type:complete len:562 (-) Transcript_4134:1490-3175(-)
MNSVRAGGYVCSATAPEVRHRSRNKQEKGINTSVSQLVPLQIICFVVSLVRIRAGKRIARFRVRGFWRSGPPRCARSPGERRGDHLRDAPIALLLLRAPSFFHARDVLQRLSVESPPQTVDLLLQLHHLNLLLGPRHLHPVSVQHLEVLVDQPAVGLVVFLEQEDVAADRQGLYPKEDLLPYFLCRPEERLHDHGADFVLAHKLHVARVSAYFRHPRDIRDCLAVLVLQVISEPTTTRGICCNGASSCRCTPLYHFHFVIVFRRPRRARFFLPFSDGFRGFCFLRRNRRFSALCTGRVFHFETIPARRHLGVPTKEAVPAVPKHVAEYVNNKALALTDPRKGAAPAVCAAHDNDGPIFRNVPVLLRLPQCAVLQSHVHAVPAGRPHEPVPACRGEYGAIAIFAAATSIGTTTACSRRRGGLPVISRRRGLLGDNFVGNGRGVPQAVDALGSETCLPNWVALLLSDPVHLLCHGRSQRLRLQPPHFADLLGTAAADQKREHAGVENAVAVGKRVCALAERERFCQFLAPPALLLAPLLLAVRIRHCGGGFYFTLIGLVILGI